MTVPATPRRAGPYDGNNVTTAFGFSFKAFDEADVRVVVLDVPTSVESDSVLNSDYTVALNPDQESNPGGTVNYLVAPAATKKVTLIGDVNYEQPIDLPDGGAYRAQQVEDGMDRLAIQMQQLKEIIDRCAQVPVSSQDTSTLLASINTLSANIAILQTIVANIGDLITLAGDIDDVSLLASISAQIQTVASIAAQVVAVASISAEVVAVDGISVDVQTVAANMAAILAAVADLPALAGKANSGAIGASLLTMATARLVGRLTGGTGATEELTATQVTTSFVNAATDTAAGKVELATLAEVKTGTDTGRVVTPEGLASVLPGFGQTAQDLTASRALGVTYTNTTDKTIFVWVTAVGSTNASCAIQARLNGTIVAYANNTESNGTAWLGLAQCLFLAVPPGFTYRVEQQTNTSTLGRWGELR